MSLPQERSTAEQVFYTWVARSRSGSSSFTASALNKASSSSSSSSSLTDNLPVPASTSQHNSRPVAKQRYAHALRDFHSVVYVHCTFTLHTLV